MRDVLLIDTKKRTFRHRAGRSFLFARQYNVFFSDSGRVALEMLKTAVMDAVVLNLSGPGEDATDLVGQISRMHPRVEILFLSASEIDRMMEKQFRYGGLIEYLRDYLHDLEEQQGRLLGERKDVKLGRWFDDRMCINQG